MVHRHLSLLSVFGVVIFSAGCSAESPDEARPSEEVVALGDTERAPGGPDEGAASAGGAVAAPAAEDEKEDESASPPGFTSLGEGVAYARAGSGDDAVVVYGGYGARETWVRAWAVALSEAKLLGAGFGHVYMKGRLALCAMRDLSAAEIVALPMPGWARAAYASYPELEPDIRPFRSVPEVREPSSARERRTSELPTAIGQVAPWVHALAELDPSSDTVETPKGDRPDFVCVERDIALAAWTAMERMPEAFRLAAQHVSLVVFGAQGTVGLHVGGRRVRAPEVAGLVGWLRSAMSKGPFELRTPSLVVVGHAEGQTCVAAIATTAEGERTAKSVVAAYLLCLLGALEELRATR